VGLRIASFESGTRQEHRLFRGSPSDFEIAASFVEDGYFSHQTAAILHSLLQFAPTRFFINNEQSPKRRSTNLNQEAIRLAFSRRPRHSQLIFRQTQLSNGCEYVMLGGKYSGNTGQLTIAGLTIARQSSGGQELGTGSSSIGRVNYRSGSSTVIRSYSAESRSTHSRTITMPATAAAWFLRLLRALVPLGGK
jgi:hypothetical protein